MLSRFVRYNRWCKPTDNPTTVRPAAFMPNPKNGETSVFRISGISNEEIWNIGERDAPKPILGRADIMTLHVLETNLQVFPNEPPARHANIVGWPAEKSKQKLIAIELANKAKFHKK